MEDISKMKRVLIIDREQSFWRNDSAEALAGAGFEVRVLDQYEYPPPDQPPDEKPDLVVLGCSGIKHDERELIRKILSDHRHLLVFSITLPWTIMRSIFLAGADDVVNKPYDPSKLVDFVNDVFASMTPRDNYQAMELKE